MLKSLRTLPWTVLSGRGSRQPAMSLTLTVGRSEAVTSFIASGSSASGPAIQRTLASRTRSKTSSAGSRGVGGSQIDGTLTFDDLRYLDDFERQSISAQSCWHPVWPECSAQYRRLFSCLDGRLRQARDRWHFLRRSGKSKRADFGTSVRVRLSYVQPCSDRRSERGRGCSRHGFRCRWVKRFHWWAER